MKYEEILPAVLKGKWFRADLQYMWVRMNEDGILFDMGNNEVKNFHRNSYLWDTWKVKPEEITIWCVSHKINAAYDNFIGKEPRLTGLDISTLISISKVPLFPIDSPTKYKLTLLED